MSGVQVKAPSPGSTVGNDTIHELIGRFDATSFDINNLPTTADYPSKWADKSPLQAAVNNQSKINAEKLALSKSQPDLTSVGILKSDFTGKSRISVNDLLFELKKTKVLGYSNNLIH